MPDNLVIAVAGKTRSGKSHTWNKLFGRTVRTGRKLLQLRPGEFVEVFLISGSPQEQRKFVGENIPDRPRIILCSIRYSSQDITRTIGWFVDNEYFLFVYWLNPGYRGSCYPDTLQFA